MVRPRARRRRAGRAGETLRARGNDLDEGLHHGTRTVRWRRHRAHSSLLRVRYRLAAPGSPVRSRLAGITQPFDPVRLHLSRGTRPGPRDDHGEFDYAAPE